MPAAIPPEQRENRYAPISMLKHKVLHAVMRLKLWELENLPASNSLVAQRVFFHLVNAYSQGKSLTIKALGLGLPFSAAAIRMQTRKLEKAGWLRLERGNPDSRQRIVVMSQKSVDLLRNYERQALRLARPR